MKRQRKKRSERRAGPCAKCSVHRRSLHKDHIVPVFKGGTDDPSNIQWICANCHEDKTREDMLGRDAPWTRGPITEKRRRAISKGRKGCNGGVKTPEQCAAISKRLLESYATGRRVAWNKGKHLSAAHRRHTAEGLQRARAAGKHPGRSKGSRFTEEQRVNISNGLLRAYADKTRTAGKREGVIV